MSEIVFIPVAIVIEGEVWDVEGGHSQYLTSRGFSNFSILIFNLFTHNVKYIIYPTSSIKPIKIMYILIILNHFFNKVFINR